MLILRPALQRGHSQSNWLNSYHTFSFADYYDPAWTSFGTLRVINEDDIAAGQGFNKHPHSDMEIITYVVSGALKHHDSMGTGSVIRPGEIQRMSAGRGIWHSEFNDSKTESLHLLQIWIFPEKTGLEPGYEQKKISKRVNQMILIGSNQPSATAVTIHQKVQLYVGYFEKGYQMSHTLQQPQAWLQLIKGRLEVNGQALQAGDGLGIQDEKQLELHCLETAEFLWFELG